jgi:hypothetical protein
LSRKLLAGLLTLVLAGWLLQGCAPSGGKMTPATASRLQRDVTAVVSAADASRWDAAIDALNQLDADIASAQAGGELSEERATQSRTLGQRVLEDLQQIRRSNPTPGDATTTQTTPSTETSDTGGNSSGNDGHGEKSKEDDQGIDDDGKHKTDDQGEDDGKHHGKGKKHDG